ncbi:MAG: hypothetical protein CSA20_06200 [Deltaproteobacteria bacterium]|nr:MAG: hypothetical protein CSA20_06200 [Deltaproteobacteria bacterium]
MAFTWLNPHVYLDTIVFIGSVSTRFPDQKFQFTVGASLASFLFFFSLGYGARFLSPLFTSVVSWKVLDFFIGLVLWFAAANMDWRYFC